MLFSTEEFIAAPSITKGNILLKVLKAVVTASEVSSE